jgi:3-oxoacyl-[acyl-carrier-protein] synthase II
VEAALTALALHHGIVPPTINVEHQDPECDVDVVPNKAREVPIKAAISNSFGFGGTNAVIAFQKFE